MRARWMKKLDPLIRPATTDDIPGIGMVHALSWQAAYKGIIPIEFLMNRTPEVAAKQWSQPGMLTNLYVAEIDGKIGGIASMSVARDARYEGWGELYALYVHPAWFGHGLGYKLFKAAQARLEEKGFNRSYVWVLEDNRTGCRFYERVGGVQDGGEKQVAIGGKTLKEIAYVWPDA